MDVTLCAQYPNTPKAATIRARLAAELGEGRYDVVRVAVAYATVPGVRQLLAALGVDVGDSRWLIGLDDAFTQPGVIDAIQRLPGARIRVATYGSEGLRFHPKVFAFGTTDPARAGLTLAVVGSANLTARALAGNAEAVAILRAKGRSDREALASMWDDLWKQGTPLKKFDIQDYRARFEAADAQRRATRPVTRRQGATGSVVRRRREVIEILETDDADLDPSLARTCWIEVGKNTALGRELEIKAEQGLFFGLSPGGGAPRTFRFRLASGAKVPLRFVYQRNHMWRLQMNNEVPEVRDGLRPRLPNGSLGRSPYVAAFHRTRRADTFELGFLKIRSREFKDVLREARRRGTVGQTTARRYGWC